MQFVFVLSLMGSGLAEADGDWTQQGHLQKHYSRSSRAVEEEQQDKSPIIDAPISIEILRIYAPFEPGNTVKLIWGKQIDEYPTNLTYSIHYGISEDDLKCMLIF